MITRLLKQNAETRRFLIIAFDLNNALILSAAYGGMGRGEALLF